MAKLLAELSDRNRRAATRERAPVPENPVPFSRGNTPEKIEGAPELRAAGAEPPEPPAPAAPAPAIEGRPEPPAAPPRIAGNLGGAFRDLQRYLQDQNFDNPQGGAVPDPGFQFDSKGIDFGPWLLRFKNQIRRNWLIPQVAELTRGRVVIQFSVLRNGTLVGLRVARPAGVEALTVSAMTALKLSNPTSPLPPEYPDEQVDFTVTFYYNEYFPGGP
jgi:TonB family protein